MRGSLSAALLIAAAALSLNACAYHLPGADPQLEMRAKHALRHQDKPTLLELGIRYEYGHGVPVNWKLAGGFYAAAATGTPGGNFTMGPGGKLSYQVGRRTRGLPEAKARLQALRAKMKAAGYRCSGVGWSMVFC